MGLFISTISSFTVTKMRLLQRTKDLNNNQGTS